MQPDNVPEKPGRMGLKHPVPKGRWLSASVSLGVISTLTVGAHAVPASAAVDNHPEEAAEASASIVDSSILGTGLAGGGRSEATWEADPGPNAEALNVDALGSEMVQLGDVEVPLTEIVDFGQVGALQSQSEASSPQDARATTGVAGADGSVHLDGSEADFGAAHIDMLSLLEHSGVSGVTDLLVDEASLYLGAGGAQVIAEDGEFLDQDGVGGPGQYRAGEASIVLQSPAVEEAAGMIYDTIGEIDAEVEDQVNSLLDLTDILDAVPGDTSVDAEVTSEMQEEIFSAVLAEPITTNNEVLTIDFSAGTMELHLDQILSGEMRPDQPTGMNNQNPNTELIDDELYPMVAETVHDAMEEVTNIVLGAVEGAAGSVTVDLEASVGDTTATWGVNLMDDEVRPLECEGGALTCTTLETTVNTVIAPLVDTALVPAREFVVGDAGQEVFDLLVRDIKTNAITVPIRGVLEPFIEMAAQVLSVQLNRQVAETCELPDGTEVTESLEVSALSVGFLQAADAGRLNLGTAGARIDACETDQDGDFDLSLTVDPTEVEPGDATDVSGSGFSPDSPATVELVDSEGNPVGDPEEVTTDEDGAFQLSLPVPEDAEPGELVVRVTDEETGEQTESPLTVTDPSEDGSEDGTEDGTEDSDGDGAEDGTEDGDGDGAEDGTEDGTEDGDGEGAEDGTEDGTDDGAEDGTEDGDGDGAPAPSLIIQPDTAEPGDTVTIEGGDLPEGSTGTLEVTDPEGNVIDTVENIDFGEGDISESWTIPEGTEPGVLIFTITDDEDPEVGASEVVDVVDGDAADQPTTSVQPEQIPAGGQITVAGDSYVPGSTVTLEIIDLNGNVVDTVEEAPVSEDGTVSITWTVPEGTDPGALIAHLTDVEDPEVTSAGSFDVVDGDSIVIDPSLSAEPEALQPGEELTLQGSGYSPGRTVEVIITDADGEPVDTLEGVEVGQDGLFSVSWTVPEGTEPGGLFVTAEDTEDPEIADTVSFSVTDGPADEAPTLSADPRTVAPGEEAVVTGGNFVPGNTVELEFTDFDGEVISTETAEVQEDGSFSITWTVPSELNNAVIQISATDPETGDNACGVLKVLDEAAIGQLSISVEHGQIQRGAEQIGYATGYVPGAEVSGVMNSEPTIDLGTEVADEDGVVSFSWEVPTDAELGTHTFSTTAEGYDEQGVSFQVTDGESGSGEEGPGIGTVDPESASSGGSEASSKPSGGLAATGVSGSAALTGLALLALAAGAGVLFLNRRKGTAAE